MSLLRSIAGLLLPAVILAVALTLAPFEVHESDARSGQHHAVSKPTVYGLDFVSPTNGWVVGDGATILRTATGGRTWIRTTASNEGEIMYDAHFSSRLSGWVVGSYGASWRTTNGGVTWRRRDLFETGGNVGLKLLGPSLGWAVDGDVDDRAEHAAEETYTVLKTTTGGSQWVTTSSAVGSALTDIDFVNETSGWAAGALAVPWSDEFGNIFAHNVAMLMGTKDGGATWSSPLGPTDFGIAGTPISHLWAVDFKNALCGWAVGDVQPIGSSEQHGLVIRTVDGGATWSSQISGRFTRFTHVSMATTKIGWVTGEGGGRRLLKTANGGRTWTTQFLPRGARANDVDAVNKTTAFVAAESVLTNPAHGLVARTTDGGAHWVRLW